MAAQEGPSAPSARSSLAGCCQNGYGVQGQMIHWIIAKRLEKGVLETKKKNIHFAVGPKNTKHSRMNLRIGLTGLIVGATCAIVRIGQLRAGFIILFFPRSARTRTDTTHDSDQRVEKGGPEPIRRPRRAIMHVRLRHCAAPPVNFYSN